METQLLAIVSTVRASKGHTPLDALVVGKSRGQTLITRRPVIDGERNIGKNVKHGAEAENPICRSVVSRDQPGKLPVGCVRDRSGKKSFLE